VNLRRHSNRFFLPLSADPPVIYLQSWLLDWKFTAFRLLLQFLRGRRAYLLVHPSWSHEKPQIVKRVARRIKKHRFWYGDHRIIYLANTLKEEELFRENGIRAIFCNQNAFLDPSLFLPIPDMRKRFRAIYDAAFIPYKRHFLAGRVVGLALTAYVKKDTAKRDIRLVKETLSHAEWLRDGSTSGNLWLDDSEINRFLNEARVGLCLSAVEGAMYASAQYLLAGLPVVTTHSRGGRDVFFQEKFVRYVADDPAAVAAAVDEFCADPLDPTLIRDRTMECFAEHRGRFVDLMNSIYRDEGRREAWADEWPDALPNKLHGGGFPLRAHISALSGRQSSFPWMNRDRDSVW